MLNQSLKSALPTVMRYLSDQVGVEVVWGGSQAHTWDGVLYLPVLKDEPGIDIMALGYGTHESAHVLFSTQGVYAMAAEEPPFVVKLMNVLEDVRIERLMMAKHTSVRPWLHYLVGKVLGGAWSSEGLSEASILHDAILLVGRARMLGQPLEAEAAQAHKALIESFGLGRTTKIMALVGKIHGCPDTQAVYELTHKILTVLDEEEPEKPQEKPKPKPDSSPADPSADSGDGSQAGGQDAKPETDPSQANSGNSGESGNGDESGSAPGKGTEPGSDAGAGAGAGAPGDDAGTKPGSGPSLKDRVLGATADELNNLKSDLGEAAAKILNQSVDKNASSVPAAIVRHPTGNELLCKVTAASGRAASMGMRQVLMGLLQGSQNARPAYRKTGNRVDGSRLARVVVGETRIFRKTEPVQRVNAAFQILLDASGSMGSANNKAGKSALRLAEESVLAVLHSLEGLQGVSSGAMVFPRSGVKGSAVSVGVLKRHNQTLASAVRESRFGVTASGGTPLAEAIWPAAGDLLAAKGERKVLVVITDGDPNAVSSAAEMVQRCRASGIEVFAIAFGSVNGDSLNRVYGNSHWAYLEDITELKAGLSKLVKQVLTQKAA